MFFLMNEDYPKSPLEFEERFANEEACLSYLCQLRWANGFVCPGCEGGNAWKTCRGLFHCRQCGRQTSPTAGTIFHRTRMPLRLWFHAIWHITNQKYGANALGLQRILGFGSYQTAWEWLHKLRRAMVRPSRNALSGVVEVDETYIGGAKSGKRGRGAAGKSLVAVAIELKGRGVAIFAKACFGHPSPSKRQKLNATTNAFGTPDVLRTCHFATIIVNSMLAS